MVKKVFVGVLLLLILFTSCKQNDITSSQNQETKEADTNDLFDDVLTGANTVQEEEATDEKSEESEKTEKTDDESTSQESYSAPECGDSICTYYETFSSCPEDCEKLEETTLYDYPTFLNDPIIVVGNDAPSTDVITATVISTYLVTHHISAETRLASEIADFTSNDLILIGSPCENEAIAKLLHYTAETCAVVSSMNNAVIKLLVSETNEILIITGYDNGDTKDASKMLTTDGRYNLNGAEEWINLNSNGDINLYFSKN